MLDSVLFMFCGAMAAFVLIRYNRVIGLFAGTISDQEKIAWQMFFYGVGSFAALFIWFGAWLAGGTQSLGTISVAFTVLFATASFIALRSLRKGDDESRRYPILRRT